MQQQSTLEELSDKEFFQTFARAREVAEKYIVRLMQIAPRPVIPPQCSNCAFIATLDGPSNESCSCPLMTFVRTRRQNAKKYWFDCCNCGTRLTRKRLQQTQRMQNAPALKHTRLEPESLSCDQCREVHSSFCLRVMKFDFRCVSLKDDVVMNWIGKSGLFPSVLTFDALSTILAQIYCFIGHDTAVYGGWCNADYPQFGPGPLDSPDVHERFWQDVHDDLVHLRDEWVLENDRLQLFVTLVSNYLFRIQREHATETRIFFRAQF